MSKSFFITRRNGERYEVIVDDDKYNEVMQYKWCVYTRPYSTNVYVGRNLDGHSHLLHWQIAGKPEPGYVIDHINGRTLDNRACNLRHCTQLQNSQNKRIHRDNTSGYKGVTLNKQRGKWEAQIKINKKTIRIGAFDSPDRAYQAYCETASKAFGEFFNPGK